MPINKRYGFKDADEAAEHARRLDQTKRAWWDVFTTALYTSVDDAEDLMRSRDPDYARKLAEAARNIADAAIDTFEERFLG